MSYFELRDYIKELGYTIDCEFFIKWDGLFVLIDNDKVIFEIFNMINDGDTVEVYFFHGVGEKFFNEASNPNNQPTTSTFPSNPTTGPSETSSTPFEDQPNTVPLPSPSSMVPPPFPSTVPPSSTMPPPSPSIMPPSSTVPPPLFLLYNDPTDDEVEDESGSEGDTNEDNEVDSDIHQEYIDIRTSLGISKSHKGEVKALLQIRLNVYEKGPDIGYD
ncbi:hypothetical protein R3W88_023309 [Solanum pinnatisectum]|uniref:Uncharacterized protein n=1 Tax=Solanum pinnatisectum TaxID=50273 RepID=A0AAV9LX77_9SOLN|nr:hypothetical protein R3W88_023309 [Solanum pinnatisectum]